MSWVEIRRDLKNIPKDGHIVSLDDRTSKFSLTFFLPDKNWIFLNEKFSLEQLSRCKGKLYYFDVVPYGMEEELDKNEVLFWENLLREEYDFNKTNEIAL